MGNGRGTRVINYLIAILAAVLLSGCTVSGTGGDTSAVPNMSDPEVCFELSGGATFAYNIGVYPISGGGTWSDPVGVMVTSGYATNKAIKFTSTTIYYQDGSSANGGSNSLPPGDAAMIFAARGGSPVSGLSMCMIPPAETQA